MTKTDKSFNTPNIFGKIRKKFGHSRDVNSSSSDAQKFPSTTDIVGQSHAPYYSQDLTNVLFLSKRGMSRSPLAREVMRSLLHLSDHFGSIRPSARGISDAYEFCPFDKRMTHMALKFGYELSGNSRRVNMAELSSANLIITLDQESEEYAKSRKFYIRGQVRPIGMFLPAGQSPYIADPFERGESSDANSTYEEIIRSVEYGCGKVLKFIPSIV
jgi:protein-tyrosine-phosphatase